MAQAPLSSKILSCVIKTFRNHRFSSFDYQIEDSAFFDVIVESQAVCESNQFLLRRQFIGYVSLGQGQRVEVNQVLKSFNRKKGVVPCYVVLLSQSFIFDNFSSAYRKHLKIYFLDYFFFLSILGAYNMIFGQSKRKFQPEKSFS